MKEQYNTIGNNSSDTSSNNPVNNNDSPIKGKADIIESTISPAKMALLQTVD